MQDNPERSHGHSHEVIHVGSSFKLVSALLAFLIWGTWAYYVNQSSGVFVSLKSGLIQGAASGFMTLIMVRIVSKFYQILPKNLYWLALPPLLTVVMTGSCIVALHWLANTPDIVRTVVPPFSMALMFCAFTTYKLHSANNLSELQG